MSKTAAVRPGKHAAPAPQRPSARGVLQLIWRERRISRAEIARRTELSRSTVSAIVDELLATGLVTEAGSGESIGGRRPIVLAFRDDAYGILGVDLGAAHVAVALTDLRGRVLAWEHRYHPVRSDPEGALALTRELARRCAAAWKPGRDRLLGIGVSVACPVDPKRPDQLFEVVLPAWRGWSVHGALREAFGLPVFLDNDANLGALAERWWGAGRDVADFAYIKVATGIGSGHIIGGQIYRGATGIAGEIGHLAMDPQGEPCSCGLRGCLSTLVGAAALTARAKALLKRHPRSALARKKLTITAIEDAALDGDELALQVVREAAEHLGIAIAGLLNLMNPAAVIIGGGLARVGDLLLEPLREVVRRRTLVSSAAAAEIRTSELGARAMAVGAATLVLQTALDDPSHFPATAGVNG